MNPCEQKEHIETLYNRSEEAKTKLHEMEVRQVEILGDVRHIRDRIENGMSTTIKSMHDKLIELLPRIEHHNKWVGYIEATCVWIVRGVVAAGCGVIIWAVANGWKP